uniref:Putative sulfotransferase fat body overexpressed n=1 Tax=Rhipicephalus microplus TaxID=6941 RepID=A0A6M2D3C4_RHIMP
MDNNCYKKVAGVQIPKIFNDENFRSAVKYVPRDGDLYIVTYPKCGTSWMQYIVCSILTRGDPPSNVVDLNAMAPFIDVCGAEIAENHERTGPVVTHIPFTMLRPSERAKYIYVARNPYDCAVSCYHFMKGFIPKTTGDVLFESFLPKFTGGMLAYGDYFDHVLPWYNLREEANVLFLTYEKLKADTAGQIFRIADFIGSEHGAMLRDNEAMLSKVLDSCSIESMKKIHNDDPVERVMKLSSFSSSASTSGDEDRKVTPLESRLEGSGFIRKAIVGDWKNYFTGELVGHTKSWIEKKCKTSAIMQL